MEKQDQSDESDPFTTIETWKFEVDEGISQFDAIKLFMQFRIRESGKKRDNCRNRCE